MRRAVLLAAGWTLLLGCRPEVRPEVPATPRPHAIVLISIDTLRADHLPVYGYRGVETPAIDALASSGIVVRRAYSHVPLTAPSHVSILTGLLPHVHGVRDNSGYPFAAQSLPSLPRELHRLGYATGGFVSVVLLGAGDGFAEGFDAYDDRIDTRVALGAAGAQRSGVETLARAVEWIDSLAGKPFFLFLHLYEPHTPYRPPEPFASRYPSAYDGEIAASDAIVGRLVAALAARRFADRTAFLLISDHGEGLNDHGEREHGILLYEESLRVPMILGLPGDQRPAGCAEVDAAGQLVDVLPTLVRLAGGTPPAGGEGVSILDFCAPDAPRRRVYAETFYPRLHLGWSELATLIDLPHQYIRGPAPELYDLERDPRQVSNLLASEPAVVRRLDRALDAFDRALGPPAPVGAEQRQALAALGYLGDAATTADGDELPDPKSRLASLAVFDRGIDALARGDLDAAARDFRATTAANPRMVDAWEYLGIALGRAGRLDEAVDATRQALSAVPHSPSAAIQLARLLIATERLDEAVTFVRQQLVLIPHEVRLRLLESYACLHAGRLDEARDAAEAAVAQAPGNADAIYQRGSVAIARQRLDDAERDFRHALELAPDHTAAMSDLALLLEHRGAHQEARELLARVAERAAPAVGAPARE